MAESQSDIVVVSGLPRSGTSMMMRMLAAGGLPVLTDEQRVADEDNPRGYYEWEAVKALPDGDYGWLPGARGRAVKVVSALLRHLPPAYRYRVLFMERHLPEVLASQRKMLARRGKSAEEGDEAQMAGLFKSHLAQVQGWLQQQPNVALLVVPYNDLLAEPRPQVARVAAFLEDFALDQAQMAAVIDPTLYRNVLRDP